MNVGWRSALLALTLVALLLNVSSAGAARGRTGIAAPTPPGWQMARRWEELSDDQKRKARRNYERYRRLPPNERRAIDRKYERWKGLEKGDRDRLRRDFQRRR